MANFQQNQKTISIKSLVKTRSKRPNFTDHHDHQNFPPTSTNSTTTESSISISTSISTSRSSKPNDNHQKSRKMRVYHCNLYLLLILAGSLIQMISFTNGQCPIHTMTSFERISGVTVNPDLLTVLYTAPNITQPIPMHHISSSVVGMERQSSLSLSSASAHQAISIPITAECNNRCRRSARCRAFLFDYARHTCYSIDSSSSSSSALSSSSSSSLVNTNQGLMRQPTPIKLLPTPDRTSYFEKICLNLPAIDCERAWIYERVPSYQLHSHDDKIIDDVPSRLRCQEHCLNEREFKCRSGEYDNLNQQCRLSMLDRHVKPNSFRPTTQNIDYFENQCVPVGNQCDAFDRFEDLDLGRAEIMRSANTSDQCQLFCTQTIKAFVCRSFTWNPLTGKCYLNSANTFTVGGLDKLISAPGLIYYQRNDCIDLKLECDTNAMTLQLRTNEPFRGRMYVRDEPNLCETLGRSSLSSSLSIPFNHHGVAGGNLGGGIGMGRSCATRELPSRYSSVVVVQQHPLIQRKSDRYIKVVCDFQTANKTISSSYNVVANPWTSTALINATSFAPKIRLRITDRSGSDITGAKLGDELFLRIEAETESVYDMVARSVLAKSGTSEESIALIDKDGCPTDFRIFPPLKKLNRRTIVGKFDAFKFSSDVVVRFQVDVQFCLNQCPPASCDHLQQLQQNLLNAPPQLPASVDGVENYSAGSLRPSPGGMATTSNHPNIEVPSTQQPTQTPVVGTTTTAPSTSQSISPTADSSMVSVLQQSETVPAISSSSSSYPMLDSGLRTPANMLSSSQYYSDRLDHQHQQQRQQQQQQQHLNGHQQSPMNGNHLNNYQISANQVHTFMGAESQHTQTGDSQTFESTARAKLDNSQPNKRQQQQQQQNSNRRRRRRSVESIPSTPRHVPLQREIIVESTGGGGANNKQTNGDQMSKQQQQERQISSSMSTKQTTEGRAMRTKITSKTNSNNINNNIDFIASPNSKANGSIRNGPAYDTAGNKLSDNDDSGSSSSSSSRLFSDEQRQTTSTTDGEDNNDNGTLLCTTRQSLVLASLVFCAIQLLSFGLCLVTWLHKRDGCKFKVRQQHQTTTFSQRHPHPPTINNGQQVGQRFY